MKPLLLIISLFLAKSGYGQLPDTCHLHIKKDTLSSYSDCVISIELWRKDRTKFKFPARIQVGDVFKNADLLIDIQILNDKNEYEDYRCNQSPISLPSPPVKVPSKYYRKLIFTDSLDDLSCITRGNFRIRILVNSGRLSQSLEGNIINTSSNWVYFYLNADKISLGYSREVELREKLNLKKN